MTLSDAIMRPISLSLLIPMFPRPVLIIGDLLAIADPERTYPDVLYLSFSVETREWIILKSRRGENKRAFDEIGVQRKVRARTN